MKKTCLGIIFALGISLSAYAETSLWKVQKNSFTVYIGGTIHVLRNSDYPLPKEFYKAYEDSDIVVFETDLEKFNSPEIQQLLMKKVIYTDGLSLKKVLSSETYDFLKNYCDEVGIPVFSLNHLKPSIIVLTLLVLELKKMGIDQKGVDLYFYQQATTDGKNKEALETVKEQIEFISSMGDGNENNFIVNSIKDLKKTSQIFSKIIDAWKKGNERQFYEAFIGPMKKDYPDLYRTLLVERNRDWLHKIGAYLKTPQKELVLIGVGHLGGEDGIIQGLKKRGYKIEKWHYEE